MIGRAVLAAFTAILVAPYSWLAALLVVAVGVWMVRSESRRPK